MSFVSKILLLAAALLTFGAGADHLDWQDENRSYDRARRAVERGDALPLAAIIGHLHETAPGQIVSLEYEYEFDRWVYEFKVIDGEGRLQKVHLDARSGALVRIADH